MRKGALLAKMDVQSAFRTIPVHPADHHFLGVAWEKQLYVDTTLPFGLRSALFNAVADALEWILKRHYLDDFIVAGHEISLGYLAS